MIGRGGWGALNLLFFSTRVPRYAAIDFSNFPAPEMTVGSFNKAAEGPVIYGALSRYEGTSISPASDGAVFRLSFLPRMSGNSTRKKEHKKIRKTRGMVGLDYFSRARANDKTK